MKRQNIEVVLEQPGTDDLLEYVVRTDNRDLVRWDLTRVRRGWPATSEAPFLWMTVLGYFALIRAGEISDKENVEAFIDRCLSAKFVNEDGSPVTAGQADAGQTGTTVDPSQPEVASGY